jgi:hypothetical protein
MRKAVLILGILMLAGCGSDGGATAGGGDNHTTFDENQCPVTSWEYGTEGVTFTASNTLTLSVNLCDSSGTYTCDRNTRSLTLTITAADSASFCSGERQEVGAYNCTYEYTPDSVYGVNLILTCPTPANSGNQLQVAKTFHYNP